MSLESMVRKMAGLPKSSSQILKEAVEVLKEIKVARWLNEPGEILPETACYCSATNPPCNWCMENSPCVICDEFNLNEEMRENKDSELVCDECWEEKTK